MDFGAALRANGSGCHGVMAIKPTSFVQSFVSSASGMHSCSTMYLPKLLPNPNLRLSDEPNLHKPRSGKN